MTTCYAKPEQLAADAAGQSPINEHVDLINPAGGGAITFPPLVCVLARERSEHVRADPLTAGILKSASAHLVGGWLTLAHPAAALAIGPP